MLNRNSNSNSNFESDFGLYSQAADDLVEEVIQQAIREGWIWPQMFYYMCDELEGRIPELEDFAARSAIYDQFQNRGGQGNYEDYFEYFPMWQIGSYREHMTEPLGEENNNASSVNSNVTQNLPRPIPGLPNNNFARAHEIARLLQLPPSEELNRAIQAVVGLVPPMQQPNRNQNNYARSLQGLFYDPIPRNATNTIMGNEIEEGENMINFQREVNLGRYYKKSTFNAMPTPKKNPYTRKLIESKNVIPYKARLEGGKQKKRRTTARRNRRLIRNRKN